MMLVCINPQAAQARTLLIYNISFIICTTDWIHQLSVADRQRYIGPVHRLPKFEFY